VLVAFVAADAAPAPLPRREAAQPVGAVVIDFSPLNDPPPQTDGWSVYVGVHDTLENHRISLNNWTGVAGKGAARWMAVQIDRALNDEGSGVTARRDRSGKRLLLTSNPPGVLLLVRVRLKGLPASQTPTVRPSR
jgi:hypothetical protein